MRVPPSLAIAARALASTGKGETGEAEPRRVGAGSVADLGGATRTPLLDVRAAARDGDTLRTPWLASVDEALERYG